MIKGFILLICTISLNFAFASGMKVIKDSSEKDTLKLLTWNVYMLPGYVYHKTAKKKERAHEIVKVLSRYDYDIIIFQETFQRKARKIILKGLKSKFPYHYGPLNGKGIHFRFNGGVTIISKFPLKLLRQIVFKDSYGYDKYARKGAMLLQGMAAGKVFQVAGTHIQAAGNKEFKYLQLNQVRKELLDVFIKDGVPQIICGDMNLNAHDSTEYNRMISILGTDDGRLRGEKRFSKANGREIDYILIKTNNSEIKVIKRKVVIFKSENPDIEELSDHYAIEAEVII